MKLQLLVPLALSWLSFLTVGNCTSQISDTHVADTDIDQALQEEMESTALSNETSCDTMHMSSRWSEENLIEVSNLWNFTAKEQDVLKQVGNSLSDIDHWKNDPFEVARYLWQFDMDPSKCEKLFRDMVQWRVETDRDTFMERYQEPAEIFHHTPVCLLAGLDKEGDPILVNRIGSFDAWGVYQQVGSDAMLDADRFLSELISTRGNGMPTNLDWQQYHYEPMAGKRFVQFTVIVDLHGLSVRQFRPALFGLLKESARINQYHYPGLAKRVIIIRAPKIFRMGWKIAKHFYDEQSLRLFNLVTQDNYLEELQKYMDVEVLPPIINPVNGKGKHMPGYMEKIKLEGGSIPWAP
ncbi:SEC14-like protein 5 [Seminavis robusta]|uniref:SEC14-like protein 5 n=1 Tax=Seminavis robusta TaxID=568900 RepID=A0A9N8DW35_9STRA|nr:SEC14-like protein 5 [Seminavis robusta]|eukprot:Sro319_g116100.1 SEC14-like protein 5 (352) ;mRNA; r:3359-4414